MNKIMISVCFSLFFAAPALSIEAPSLELGRTLYESSEMGTKNRSCSSCHPNGKGLDLVGDFNDKELKDIINTCIRDAQGGVFISTESQEMESLLSYVRKFQKQ